MSLRLAATTLGLLAAAAAYLRSTYASIDLGVIALVAIAIGAAVVVVFPRRRVAGVWLCETVLAAFVALFRPNVTIAPWSRYATWLIVGAIGIGMFAVLIWLIMTDGLDPPSIAESRSRQSGRLLQAPAETDASSLGQIARG